MPQIFNISNESHSLSENINQIKNNLRIERFAESMYKNALAKGIAKEQARVVLPEGLTESRLYMNGTLRSWIHFIELRSANGTQREHQLVAQACAEVIAKIFPMASELVVNAQ